MVIAELPSFAQPSLDGRPVAFGHVIAHVGLFVRTQRCTGARSPNTVRAALRSALAPSIANRMPCSGSRPRSTRSDSSAVATLAFSRSILPTARAGPSPFTPSVVTRRRRRWCGPSARPRRSSSPPIAHHRGGGPSARPSARGRSTATRRPPSVTPQAFRPRASDAASHSNARRPSSWPSPASAEARDPRARPRSRRSAAHPSPGSPAAVGGRT